MWNLKYDTNETYLQNRNRLTENRPVLAKEEGRKRGKDWEFEISGCKLSHIGWTGFQLAQW